MTKLEDIIYTDYGPIEIWSQDEMAYFFQDKMLQEPGENDENKGNN